MGCKAGPRWPDKAFSQSQTKLELTSSFCCPQGNRPEFIKHIYVVQSAANTGTGKVKIERTIKVTHYYRHSKYSGYSLLPTDKVVRIILPS